MIVDAEGKVLGRVCSFVAKQALLGENVIVINAEKAVISGDADMVYGKELRKLEIKNVGNPQAGPFHQKRPDKFVRKAVRGMLPWHKFRGREAFKRVMVYMGAPVEEIKKNHNIDLKQTEITNVPAAKKKVKGVTVLQVCKTIGGAK